jgi:hypothetical protein
MAWDENAPCSSDCFPTRREKKTQKRGNKEKNREKPIVIGEGDLVKTQSTHSQFKKDLIEHI